MLQVSRKSKAAIGAGFGVGVATLTYYLWCHRHKLKGQFTEWKNERIKNAYIDTLTEKDVAWV